MLPSLGKSGQYSERVPLAGTVEPAQSASTSHSASSSSVFFSDGSSQITVRPIGCAVGGTEPARKGTGMNRSAIAALGCLWLYAHAQAGEPLRSASAPARPTPSVRMVQAATAASPVPVSEPSQVRLDPEGNPCGCGPTISWDGFRFWTRAEYLLWHVKQGPVPVPLLTTGTADDLVPGALFQPTTQILYGNDTTEFGSLNGLRLSIGGWLDSVWGLEARGFILERKSIIDEFRSDEQGNPFLLRPFFNDDTRQHDVATVSFPGLIAGGISFAHSTRLWGVEIHLLRNITQGSGSRFDALVGFRAVDLEEQLRIDENYVPLPVSDNEVAFNGGTVTYPNVISINELFRTRNQFYGVQLGVQSTYAFGNWSLLTRFEVSLGTTHSRLDVEGLSTNRIGYNGDIVAQVPFGILALPTNSGRRSSDSFAVLPAVEIRLGYQVTEGIQVHVGYNFLYLSSVMRPGEQIDSTLNPAQVPTFAQFVRGDIAPPPLVPLRKTDFWAAGLDFGIELRY